MCEVERGTANVFADIGATDSEEMLLKAQLAAKLAEVIEARKLSQAEAAELAGLPQSELSGVLCGDLRRVSEAQLLDCLACMLAEPGRA
jgi:predicted XRE-type DNA-binding protein